jgi:hypothetical protein
MRKPTPNQLQQIVYQNLVQHTQPFTGGCWQSNVAISDRMGKTMNLITNISLAMNGGDYMKGAEWGCNFEREAFHKSPTKVCGTSGSLTIFHTRYTDSPLGSLRSRDGPKDHGVLQTAAGQRAQPPE